MENLIEKIELARHSSDAMDALLTEYLPLIKQEAGRQSSLGLEYDDRVSLAMITFTNCVQQYTAGRGNFAGYVATSIRNRLIDEAKKQGRHSQRTVPLEVEDEESNVISFQQHAAIQEHQRREQGSALAEEIDRLTAQLSVFGIRLESLDRISPKHQRTRNQCARAARVLAGDPELAQRMIQTRQLPVTKLAELSGVSQKTIEKFRQYIITAALVYTGDFSGIEAFLPKGVEEDE